MKKTVAFPLIVLVALSIGCRREQKTPPGGVAKTETIAPAQAPAAPTGTEAMTQTVDIEDSRSEAEGGVLVTEGGAPATTTTAATAATAPPAKRAPSKKH